MKQYLDLVKHVMKFAKETEQGQVQKVFFGYQMRFDLSEGFPMVTTKNHLNLLFTNYFGFSKEIINTTSRKRSKM
jgi:thymidylate synthase